MEASSKLMIVETERRFPCRIKPGIAIGGFGERLTEMHAWLDQNCGADRWDGAPGRMSKSAKGRSKCGKIGQCEEMWLGRTRR